MIAIFLALVLLVQGIPISPGQTGTVTGVLKTADGKPAAGVRVAAVVRPEQLLDSAQVAAMASLTETNESGQYRLENIPPGRYFIAAGRVDQQTYYPGVLEMPGAKDILITPGVSIADIDFVLRESSSGRSNLGFSIGNAINSALIQLKFSFEGTTRIPVFSERGFPRLVVKRTADNLRTALALDQTLVTLTDPTLIRIPAEYTVTLENLPDGYSVRSISYGTTDLMAGPMTIPAAGFRTAAISPSIIDVRIAATPMAAPVTGVTVSGNINGLNGPRSIFISGHPGTLYSDGTFEFRGVQAGRHTVITGDNPRLQGPLGASLVVGSRDIAGFQLEEVSVLPADFRTPSDPVADTRAPGPIRLASLHGKIVEESTGEPIPEGIVYLGGQERSSLRLRSDGGFEIPHLLPGNYKLEIQVFGHANISQQVTIGEDDIDLNLRSRRFD